MARLRLIPATTLLVASILALSPVVSKHWPDFSCHPFNNTSTHRNAVKYNAMGWNSCREPYEKWNGTCDKMCTLLNRKVFYRDKKDGPMIFNIESFITNFLRELGYDRRYKPTVTAEELAGKVRVKMENCKATYPEYERMTLVKTPCEPWVNITNCIDKAVACE